MTKQESQESKATTKKEYFCPLILAAQPGAASPWRDLLSATSLMLVI